MKSLLCLLLALACPAWAQTSNPDLAAVAATGEGYVAAFNKGDAKAVAAFWTEDADYTDLDGQTHRGREAISALFAAYFAANPGAKLAVDSASLRFLTPDTAIEDGASFVSGGRLPPSSALYTSTLVKKDGKWLLASVRERSATAADRSQELGPLGPLLGDWVATSKDGEVRVSLTPDDSGNFLVLRRTVLAQGVPAGAGMDWIAWDPSTKSIRSWSFQSDGSFGQGAWKQDGTAWTIESQHVLRDGTKLREIQSLSIGKDGKLRARTLGLSADEKDLPTPEDLTFDRPKTQP
jgi:uncharacterized protein (TIGR02246 family)